MQQVTLVYNMFMHSRHAVEQQLFELLPLQYAIDNDVASQICGNCCDKRTQPTKSNFRKRQKVPLGIATSQSIHRPTTRKRDSGWQLATSRGPRPTPRPLRRGHHKTPSTHAGSITQSSRRGSPLSKGAAGMFKKERIAAAHAFLSSLFAIAFGTGSTADPGPHITAFQDQP